MMSHGYMMSRGYMLSRGYVMSRGYLTNNESDTIIRFPEASMKEMSERCWRKVFKSFIWTKQLIINSFSSPPFSYNWKIFADRWLVNKNCLPREISSDSNKWKLLSKSESIDQQKVKNLFNFYGIIHFLC